MKQNDKLIGILSAAALMAAAVFSAAAQDDGGEAASGDIEMPGTEAEAPAAPVKPRPAEIMPLTARSLLLDVVKTGERFVAVGDRGGIISSTNGTDWTQAPVPVRSAFTAVEFADAQNGWAVGHDATIVVTTDGGRTWKLQHFAPDLEKPFLDVLFLDATRGLAVGAYGLFMQTTDAGKSWTEVDAPSIREEEVHFNSLIRLNDGNLFIAGESGMLGLSTDEGQTWAKLASPYESSYFGALPAGEKGAVIFGLRGNVFITQDVKAGKWTQLETNSVASMFGGTVLPDGRLAMVGLNGVIFLAGSDGAVTALQAPTGTPLAAAVPLDGGLLAVGESGVQTLVLK